jgi:hypothetical protein
MKPPRPFSQRHGWRPQLAAGSARRIARASIKKTRKGCGLDAESNRMPAVEVREVPITRYRSSTLKMDQMIRLGPVQIDCAVEEQVEAGQSHVPSSV